jgi:hypothetical protein
MRLVDKAAALALAERAMAAVPIEKDAVAGTVLIIRNENFDHLGRFSW